MVAVAVAVRWLFAIDCDIMIMVTSAEIRNGLTSPKLVDFAEKISRRLGMGVSFRNVINNNKPPVNDP